MEKMTLKKKYTIAKSNRLNQLRPNELKLQELRFFNIYLAKINPTDINSRLVRFSVADFRAVMELGRVKIEHLEKTTENLLRKVVTIPNEHNAGYSQFQLFKRCRVNQDESGDWFVEFDAHDDALPLMFDLKSHYFRYELWNTLSLKSNNQLRMYEILKQYEKLGEKIVNIEELREVIGIDKKEYPRYNSFKQRVLDPCQKALSEKTDIIFTYEPYGRKGAGGKVLALKFTITKNEDYQSPINLEKYIDLHSIRQQQDAIEAEQQNFNHTAITPNQTIHTITPSPNYSSRHQTYTQPSIDFNTNTFTPKATNPSPDTISNTQHLANFETFWQSYPKKSAKKTAAEQWNALPRNASIFEKIMRGLETAKQSQDWLNDNGRYILTPTRWLKEERWEDNYGEYTYGTNANSTSIIKTKTTAQTTRQQPQQRRFQNYKGREYDHENLARLERERIDRMLQEKKEKRSN